MFFSFALETPHPAYNQCLLRYIYPVVKWERGGGGVMDGLGVSFAILQLWESEQMSLCLGLLLGNEAQRCADF